MDYSAFKVAVIGDFMLDEWVEVDSAKMSQEAMAPKILNPSIRWTLGGAGNVVANFKSLGADVFCYGVIGRDDEGKEVLRKLREIGIKDGQCLLLRVDLTCTTVKTRVLVKGQQVLRWDKEDTEFKFADSDILNELDRMGYDDDHHGFDAIVFADYNKGYCSKHLIKEVMEGAKERNIPVMVDPKYDNFWEYKGATIFKPNMREALAVISNPPRMCWPQQMRGDLDCDYLVITKGGKGIQYWGIDNDDYGALDSHYVSVVDVTGAGDTVLAVLTLEYLKTKDIVQSAKLANLAGSLAVQQYGTAQITAQELQEAWDDISN